MAKKIALIVLSFVLVAGLAIGGSVAYLTDTKEDVNVMVMGDVEIAQHEYERVVENGVWVTLLDANGDPVVDKYGYTPDALQEFTQNKPLYPAVYDEGRGTLIWDDRNGSSAASGAGSHQQSWFEVGSSGSDQLFDDSIKNVMDKFVMVENTGAGDAYFRTLIAVECPEGVDSKLIHVNKTSSSKYAWSDTIFVEIDGVRYALFVATYQEKLTSGQTARPSFLQVFLDPAATMEDYRAFNGTMEVIVLTQAVQTEGFSTPALALSAAFGDITETANPWIDSNSETTTANP